MIRFIFYTLIAYVLYKIFRVFIDPMFETTPKQSNSTLHQSNNATNQKAPKSKEPVLGEYVEYEEVK